MDNLTCLRRNCENRTPPTHRQIVASMILPVIQVSFLMVTSGLVGGFVMLRVHAQTLPTQVLMQSMRLDDVNTAIRKIEDRQGVMDERLIHQGSEIATMQGIGMGFSALLLVLQLAQMGLGKQKRLP